jgi:hypothetical protein
MSLKTSAKFLNDQNRNVSTIADVVLNKIAV